MSQLFVFKNLESLQTTIDTFEGVNAGWTTKCHCKDTFPTYPLAAVSVLDRENRIFNLHFIDPREIARRAMELNTLMSYNTQWLGTHVLVDNLTDVQRPIKVP